MYERSSKSDTWQKHDNSAASVYILARFVSTFPCQIVVNAFNLDIRRYIIKVFLYTYKMLQGLISMGKPKIKK